MDSEITVFAHGGCAGAGRSGAPSTAGRDEQQRVGETASMDDAAQALTPEQAVDRSRCPCKPCPR